MIPSKVGSVGAAAVRVLKLDSPCVRVSQWRKDTDVREWATWITGAKICRYGCVWGNGAQQFVILAVAERILDRSANAARYSGCIEAHLQARRRRNAACIPAQSIADVDHGVQVVAKGVEQFMCLRYAGAKI